jgi:hypothetical protein
MKIGIELKVIEENFNRRFTQTNADKITNSICVYPRKSAVNKNAFQK